MILTCLDSLADSLQEWCLHAHVQVTLNIQEPELAQCLSCRNWPFSLSVSTNRRPLGFGANHNQAFTRAIDEEDCDWFVVMNPDIYWPADADAFWRKLHARDTPPSVGLVCPEQLDIRGNKQDFARRLQPPWMLLNRVWRRWRGLQPSDVVTSVANADWVNGACMVLQAKAFADMGGFDERFFMYCEDTELCLRLKLAGWQMQAGGISVIHDAQRHSHLYACHLLWHITSLLRLWTSASYWRYLIHANHYKN